MGAGNQEAMGGSMNEELWEASYGLQRQISEERRLRKELEQRTAELREAIDGLQRQISEERWLRKELEQRIAELERLMRIVQLDHY